jgi:hypothetical protein
VVSLTPIAPPDQGRDIEHLASQKLREVLHHAHCYLYAGNTNKPAYLLCVEQGTVVAWWLDSALAS